MDILLNKLIDGLNGTLRGNNFAMHLYSYFLAAQKQLMPTEDMIRGFIKSSKKHKVSFDLPSQSNRDSRFVYLLLKGIRRYPGNESHYYAISFSYKKVPCSAVFLGNNGVGKTTLYNCLEKISLGKLYSIQDETFSKEDEKKYLRNFSTPLENVSIILKTPDASPIVSEKLDDKTATVVPACFCSSGDINNLLRKGLTPEFMSEQLSLSNFLALVKSLSNINKDLENRKGEFSEVQNRYKNSVSEYQLVTKFSTKKDINDLIIELEQLKDASGKTKRKNRFKIFEGKLKSDNEKITDSLVSYLGLKEYLNIKYKDLNKFIDDKKAILYNILKNYFTDQDSDNTSYNQDKVDRLNDEIKAAGNKLAELKILYPLLETDDPKMITDFSETYTYLWDAYRKIVHEFKVQSEDIFEQLLGSYFGDDVSKINIDEDESLTIRIIPKNPVTKKEVFNEIVSPQQYLNTFRFKLYCVALKVSFAFFAKRIHRNNYPIIIDDVFDSSDFSNREKIREFIKHIFKVHNKIFQSDNSLKDLQLIFFTQDDIISDAVYDGITSLDAYTPVKYSRIYNYTEANLSGNNSDMTKINVDGDEKEAIMIEDLINDNHED